MAQFRRTNFDHPFSDVPSVRQAGAVEVEEARAAFEVYAQKSPQHAELASMAWDQMTGSRKPSQYAVSEKDPTRRKTKGSWCVLPGTSLKLPAAPLLLR
ncbi:hypothetical protein QO034_02655 [Sedimentitalea sp. JM2-8]|uniref:Uncharacterized protein n=1 Tax=Sedimentitalea xiamensis TaxID=3050037 RepID=A0ABT7FA72_9RHOB|nr:hypothetical protein [Sedimentitalea xiamensis]MDK3072001.1 hypothetical protein [Sedimentitalea xiamensis]